jgi:endothelin-converting enzyme
MSLKDTSALVPILDIEHILTSLVPSDYTLDRMITQFPEFFANVSSILETTAKDTLQGFLAWKVIQATATLVDAPELKPYIQFSNRLAGKVMSLCTKNMFYRGSNSS